MTLIEKIKENEGFKERIYEDNLGKPTIGYGFLLAALTADELALNGGKVEPMSKETADKILELKLEKLTPAVFAMFDWLKEKPQNVQEVVIEMAYQLDVSKVKKFVTTMHHIRTGEYEAAYQSGMDSLWAKQTPNRAKKVLGGLL
ncbi:glycoside hydrolase family protein [Campylobacter concisus]|uniref:glycoside hydrolase family protein n=1 Tax=Campylobacter concisus TaxID=199 RepID=UPI003D1C559C